MNVNGVLCVVVMNWISIILEWNVCSCLQQTTLEYQSIFLQKTSLLHGVDVLQELIPRLVRWSRSSSPTYVNA